MKAPAKINLYLDVLGKRTDGYHNIESVMQSVDLCDIVTISADTDIESDEVTIHCNNENVPLDKTNICHKAVDAFFDYCADKRYAVEINIEKNIPMGAGLAGGSADAAAVITGLNRLFDTFLDSEELCNIGARVGADVNFCIVGRTQYCTEAGDSLSFLTPIPQCFITIGKGAHSVSTKEAYEKVDAFESFGTSDIPEIFGSGDLSRITENCRNIFEQAVSLPETEQIKEVFETSGALCSCMSGSGSAVYGIYDNANQAASAANTLRSRGFWAVDTIPLDTGVRMIDYK